MQMSQLCTLHMRRLIYHDSRNHYYGNFILHVESLQHYQLWTLKPLFNIAVDRFKNSKTELPDLSKYVQMDEKTTKNAKIMKVTHSLSRYLWKLYLLAYTPIILAQGSMEVIFKFSHFWSTKSTLKHNIFTA